MELRPYQQQAKDRIFEEWDSGNAKTLLVLPTGCGKTIVFAKVTEDCVRLGGRVLILAHRGELLDQAADKIFKTTGLCCSMEKAESTCLGEWYRVVVGSVQTLMREKRLARFSADYFDYIIIDEAHHALSDSYRKIIDHFHEAKVLGVTATPDRGDMRNLGTVFDSLAFEYTLPQAIKEGYLSPIKAVTIPLKLDLSGVGTQNGDYKVSDIDTALDPYLYQIAEEMRSYCENRKTVVFLPLVKTSQKFRDILNERGFRAAEVNGNSGDRAEVLADFENGKYNVLCNSMLLTEGWDCPSVDCVIVLRPTKVRGLYCQMVGRGTRLCEGKTELLLLDFLWHTERHELCRPAHLIALLRAVVDTIPQIAEMLIDVLPDIINGVKQIFIGIVDALPQLMKTICEALPTLIPQLVTAITDMVVYLLTHIGEIIQPLIDNLPDIIISIVDALVENVPKLIEGAIQMVLGLVENLPKIISGIIEALPEIIEKVITGLIECIPQLIEGIIELVLELTIALPDIIVGILEAIPDIMGAIGEAFVKAGPKMIAAFERIFNKLKAKLEEKFPGIGEWLAGVWENITGFFEGIGEWFRGLWENITSVFSGIGEWFAGIWNTITESWHMVFDPWVEIFKRAADWVNTNVIEPVTGFFQGLWEKVSGFFTSLWDDISSVWSTVSDWFNTNVIEPVSGFFGGVWEKVSKGASDAWEGVKKAFSPVIDWFKNTFHEAWTKVKDVFSQGGEIFTGIKEGLFNGFKVVVNGLIDGINYIIGETFWGLNNALQNIHNVEILGVRPFEWIGTVDVPQIPKLAKGGVVDKPTIAETGEDGPEAIVPLEKNTEWTENVAKQIHEFSVSAKDISRDIKPATDLTEVIKEEISGRIDAVGDSVGSVLELLRHGIPDLIDALNVQLTLDDGTLIAKITPKVDKQLGIIKRRKERG